MSLRLDPAIIPTHSSPSLDNVIGSASCVTDLMSTAKGPAKIINCHGLKLGFIDLMRFEIQGLRGSERTPLHIESDKADEFMVVIPLHSEVTIRQSGISSQLMPGNFGVLATSRPFNARMPNIEKQDDLFSELLVRVPGPTLRRRVRHIDDICAVPLDIKSGTGKILKTLLELAFSESRYLSKDQAQQLGEMVIDAVANSTGNVNELPEIRSLRASARTRIEERAEAFIQHRILDPKLAANLVAEHCNVSVRYLHAVFASKSKTVGSLIREERLRRCHSDLRNPTLGNRSITEIALRWGFNDPAYFSRAYRTKFGKSPSGDRFQTETKQLHDPSNELAQVDQNRIQRSTGHTHE